MSQRFVTASCSFGALACAGLILACGGSTQPAASTAPVEPAATGEPAALPEIPPYQPIAAAGFAGIDVYGTSQITAAQVVAAHGELLEKFGGGDQGPDMEAKQPLIDAIDAMGEFALVELSVIGYFGPKQGTYLTIDIVDDNDRAERMVFFEQPTGDVPDPKGVIAKWKQYEGVGWPLLREGKIDQKAECPAYHCIFNFEHPDLLPYRAVFDNAAANHKDALVRVLREDADQFERGMAAYVLAHMKDGDALVKLMIPSFRDPSSYVRNSAMRVVALMAETHPELEIPIEPVLQALRFPTTTDRNKAAAALAALAKKPAHHPIIIRQAGDVLLAMLQLTQPNNHDYAYEILEAISGQEYEARDYAAWQAWLAGARAASQP